MLTLFPSHLVEIAVPEVLTSAEWRRFEAFFPELFDSQTELEWETSRTSEIAAFFARALLAAHHRLFQDYKASQDAWQAAPAWEKYSLGGSLKPPAMPPSLACLHGKLVLRCMRFAHSAEELGVSGNAFVRQSYWERPKEVVAILNA